MQRHINTYTPERNHRTTEMNTGNSVLGDTKTKIMNNNYYKHIISLLHTQRTLSVTAAPVGYIVCTLELYIIVIMCIEHKLVSLASELR